MKKPKSRSIYIEAISVSPRLAMELLDRNSINRQLSQFTVNIYAEAMKRGEWRADNGETIKITRGDDIVDGQHRLWAVAECGKSVRLLFTFNVADDSFSTIDQGKRRNGSDMISIVGRIKDDGGEKNAVVKAAAIALLFKYEMGDISLTPNPTNRQYLELNERHPGVSDSAHFFTSKCHGAWKRGMVPPAFVVFFHYILTPRAPEQAEAFLIALVTGEDLRRSSPAYVLRDKLINNMLSKTKLTRPCTLAFIVKAWNAHIQGRKIKALRWSNDERFPEIILKAK